MTDEIVEQAARILRGEPTRTLGARALHLRTCTALRAHLSYPRFVELLGARPDQFTVITDQMMGDGWSAPERTGYAAALDRVGFVRGAMVVLVERDVADDPRVFNADDEAAALGATLADAHAAVLDLFELEPIAGRDRTTVGDAAVQLEELRIAYVAQLRRSQ